MNGERADLIVAIAREPLEMDPGASDFHWSVSIEVVDGGLVETGLLAYYNEAPAAGYQPRFDFVQEAQDRYDDTVEWDWEWALKKDFFIKTRNGKSYARVEFSIWPYVDKHRGDNLASIDAKVWLNSNGSRNLEFDRDNITKPAR